MYDIIWIIIAAMVITFGFLAICHGIWWVLTKCVSWLWGLLRIVKNKKEQIKGNTMVGGAKNGF
ncbi:hypothetical protein LCGC14_1007440 [marine sediment metagenome]|uniref:Uncharacterized protein n=1 Tax=marine sediment metagenome TaxID=412755 RepID=A0A0F9QJK1_9ZZZZ